MKKFENFKYNKVENKEYDFKELGTVLEIHFIKDCKYGRKIELIEEYYSNTDLKNNNPFYSASYYDKESKKGKHNWYLLCGGCSLEETINIINEKINNWNHYGK